MAHNFDRSLSASTKSVIFDLDGTLIDSQESILSSIKNALNELKIEPKVPFSKELIGPPLVDTIAKIIQVNDSSVISNVINRFKYHYDAYDCIKTQVFPGIQDILINLNNQSFKLYLATNKRLIPTKKIINLHSWNYLFKAVYCIDRKLKAHYKNKSEMLKDLLKKESIDLSSAVYIGDRQEDYEAANQNALNYIQVNWGYGTNASCKQSVNYSIELEHLIKKIL